MSFSHRHPTFAPRPAHCPPHPDDPCSHPRSTGLRRPDTVIHAESEGPIATGGTLTFTGTNIGFKTSTPIALLTGGKVDFAASSGTLQVNSNGSIRIVDLSNAEALDTDQNNALVNTQVVTSGSGYDSTPALASNHRQAAASVAAPGLFASIFSQTEASSASASVSAAATGDCNAGSVLDPTISSGSVTLSLNPGVNYWDVTAAQPSEVTQITFAGAVTPCADNPLIVNVSGSAPESLSLTMAGARDPRGILFNMPQVPSIAQGGDSIDGSILAPLAHYTKTSANLQGTAVVASADLAGSEEHYFPFAGYITTCPTNGGNVPVTPASPAPAPTPTSTPSSTPTPTPAPTPTSAPVSSPTSTATPTVGTEREWPSVATGGHATAIDSWRYAVVWGELTLAAVLLGYGATILYRRRRGAADD